VTDEEKRERVAVLRRHYDFWVRELQIATDGIASTREKLEALGEQP